MTTGTGKTVVAFQICWKLWSSRWNRSGEHRRPKMLYLADRNILIDDPKDKIFVAMGDARWKIENGEANKGREMYFSIYQAWPKTKDDRAFIRNMLQTFSISSLWTSAIVEVHGRPVIGVTATPLREDNRDTYKYFGNPIYTYSLKQGIEDGFLAPYRVHRIMTTWDAAGWRPSKDDLDQFGREIPDVLCGSGRKFKKCYLPKMEEKRIS